MKGVLRFLGRVGKGFATVAGVTSATAGASIVLSVDPSVNEALHQVGQILAALGTLVAAFGIGRKAGGAS